MSLLVPLALAWLGSLPVLIWLWRYATSRRQVRIPSLVPFEHLLRRTPTHRTRLLINWLFWLQLACLVLAALSLAEPVLTGRRARTTLVIMDTSASMQATLGGPSAFARAKQELLNRLARKEAHERWVLMASAPVTPLTIEPTSDEVRLRQLVDPLSPSDLGGNLALAGRIGRALAGDEPDTIVILTDELPPSPPDPSVDVRSFGQALPNVAIVGADLSDPLCFPAEAAESSNTPTAAHLLVTVQNFSDQAQPIRLVARVPGTKETIQSFTLEPQQQQTVPLTLSLVSEGPVTIRVEAPRDALALDNQLTVLVGPRQRIPVTVASEHPEIAQVIGRWLEACPRITWTVHDPDSLISRSPDSQSRSDAILITDHAELAVRWPSASMMIVRGPAPAPQLLLTHWLLDTTHPITSYLEPLESVVVSTVGAGPATPWSSMGGASGEPVLWGVTDGRKTPLVLALESQGHRRVTFLLDPTATPGSVPVTLVFLNSLRWLSGSRGFALTGEPLSVGSLEPGAVRIQRPDGGVERRDHPGGVFRYDAVDRVGRYRFEQQRLLVERVANFVNPVESNTMQRLSTWSSESASGRSTGTASNAHYPLVNWLLRFLLILLVLEWWLYGRKGRAKSIDKQIKKSKKGIP